MKKEEFKRRRKKKKKGPTKRYKCTLCETVVMKPHQIKTRKNYSHGRKGKATVSHTHICDGGCLVEVRKDERRN